MGRKRYSAEQYHGICVKLRVYLQFQNRDQICDHLKLLFSMYNSKAKKHNSRIFNNVGVL